MQGTEQAGLAQLDRRVGRQVHVAVDRHRQQRMPPLHVDLGHVADRDVPNADTGIGLQVGDIGQFGLNGEGTWSTTGGAR